MTFNNFLNILKESTTVKYNYDSPYINNNRTCYRLKNNDNDLSIIVNQEKKNKYIITVGLYVSENSNDVITSQDQYDPNKLTGSVVSIIQDLIFKNNKTEYIIFNIQQNTEPTLRFLIISILKNELSKLLSIKNTSIDDNTQYIITSPNE